MRNSDEWSVVNGHDMWVGRLVVFLLPSQREVHCDMNIRRATWVWSHTWHDEAVSVVGPDSAQRQSSFPAQIASAERKRDRKPTESNIDGRTIDENEWIDPRKQVDRNRAQTRGMCEKAVNNWMSWLALANGKKTVTREVKSCSWTERSKSFRNCVWSRGLSLPILLCFPSLLSQRTFEYQMWP